MKKTYVVAAGGTGGHVYPAMAVCEELIKRGHRVVFITDPRGTTYQYDYLETYTFPFPNVNSYVGLEKVRSYISLARQIYNVGQLLVKIEPDVIVGFGGYTALPVTLAGLSINIKVVIHEQNSVLGKANRVVARFASAIGTSFPETIGLKDKYKHKAEWVGMPVRGHFGEAGKNEYKLGDKFNILVMGGSQGAASLSQHVPLALSILPDDIRSKISVVQQARAEDVESVREFYREQNIRAIVSKYFNNTYALLNDCHIFIGRCGSSTIAEITAVGRPAIFLPYPYAADNHQYYNGKCLQNHGAAVVVDDNFVANIADLLTNMFRSPGILTRMREKSLAMSKPQATKALANLAEKVS